TPAPTPTLAPVAREVVGAPGPVAGPVAEPGTPVLATTELAPIVALFAPDRMSLSQLGRMGVPAEISSTAKGSLRIVLSGGGIKLVKTMTLLPGQPRRPSFKFTPAQARSLKKLRKLEVRAKLTLDSGQEIVSTRIVTVKK
ncbi:MAG: hypothetical protein Q7T55_14220, partial [Solirubrobacteraceae bacterium]|nr:hypothetical protein [Solirubrobacteraceae bacterium]